MALHVNTSITWQSCNGKIGETYQKAGNSTYLFENLKNNAIKIMLYSGNTDAVVSHIETENYIETIGWMKTANATVIKNGQDSMVGWRTQYDGLTYYVVNGAGHMVPTDKPFAAFTIFSEFLTQ